MRLVGRLGRIVRLSVLQWTSGGAEIWRTPPGPRWGVTFGNGRSSTRAFHAFQRVGVDESLRRARIQEDNTTELYGNGTTVYLDSGGEGRVIHRYYTSNKTRPLLGEQGGVLTGFGDGHHSEDIAAVVRRYVWDGIGVSRRGGGC